VSGEARLVPRATPRLAVHVAVGGGALVAAVAIGRPELAAVAVPFLVAAVLGLAAGRPPVLAATVTADRERAVEGDDVGLAVEVVAPAGVPWLEVTVSVPAALEVVGGARRVVAVPAGRPVRLDLTLRCRRWGVVRPGRLALRAFGAGGMLVAEGEAVVDGVLRVHPAAARLRSLIRPATMQVFTGSHVALERGDGIEFADLRPFAPGDHFRAVNWRASARRGELWVTQRRPERNTDVVLFLDTFEEVGGGAAGPGTLDQVVAAAWSLATRHLAAHDRVGLVGFGGVVSWLQPGNGLVHLHRIADALLDTQVVFSYADKAIDVVPVRGLPPHALVVALTPLLDPRAVRALADLRARAVDLVVIECPPEPHVPEAGDPIAAVAQRFWRMEREALRDRFRRQGVVVVPWSPGLTLEEVVAAVLAWRRTPVWAAR
jgi:uncharacterized protein (DUF58 family)